MALLNVENIGIRFGGLQALKEVSLSVEKGHHLRGHRPQWRGQDHVVQHYLRFPHPHRG